jgi:hypothetical protein
VVEILKEFIAIARYHQGRYFADVKITAGTWLDFDTGDSYNYGETFIRIMMKIDLDSE